MAQGITQLILETVVKGTEQARAQISQLSTSIQGFSEKIGAAGAALTAGITVPLIGLGANMVKISADVEESQSKFNAVFIDMADGTKKAFEEMGSDIGRSAFKLQDMGASIGSLAKGFGATNKEASELGITAVKAAVDLASFNNATDVEALNAYRSALTGEAEPMKRFGIDVSQTGLALEAQRLGLQKSVKEMTQFEKASLVASKVAFQMGSQGSLGDAARTSESFANRMKRLTDSIYDLQKSFGDIVKEAISPFLDYAIKLVDGFNKLDEPTKTMIVRIAAIAAAVGPALLVISGITTAITKMLNPTNLLITALGALAAYFVNSYLTNEDFRKSVNETFTKVSEFVVGAFTTIKKVIDDVSKFVAGVWDVIRAPVISTFTAVRDFIVNAFNVVSKEVNDWMKIIKGIFSSLWNVIGPFVMFFVKNFMDNFDTIVDFVKNVANILFKPIEIAFNVIYGVVKAFFQVLSGDFSGAWETIKSTTMNVWNGIKSFFGSILTAIGDAVYIAFNSIGNFIKNIWPNAKQDVISGFTSVFNAIKQIGDSIVNFFTGLATSAYDWGVNMIQSMVDGILSMPGKVAEAASSVASSIKDFLGFGSPTAKGPGTSVMSWMPNLTNTLADGLKSGKGVVGTAAEGVAFLINNAFGKTSSNAKAVAKSITNTVAAIPDDVLQMAGPMFDKINERYNDFFARIGKMPEKLKSPFESMYNTFRDAAEKIDTSMSKLTDSFKSNVDEINTKISEARAEIAKLQADYQKGQATDDKSLAERVVEQENLVSELKAQVAEKQGALNEESVDSNKATLQLELEDLQSKLRLEQRALEEFRDSDIDIQKQISEARKRSRQSDFENYLEDYQAKAEERLNDYNREVEDSQKKIVLYQEQRGEMENTYQASMRKIADMQEIANRIYNRAINEQVLATEAGTNLMKQYFDSVTESVYGLADALGNVSDKQKVADTTVVSGNQYASGYASPVEAAPEYDYMPSYIPPIVAPPSGGDIYVTVENMYGEEEYAMMMGTQIARQLGLNNAF